MVHQISVDSLESFRLAFLKLEHACSDCDETAVAHLRRTFLSSLAEAEAELAIIESLAPFEAARMAPHSSLAELQALEDDSANIPPHKLD